MRKCVMSAGGDHEFAYPRNDLGICVEQWGNAWVEAGYETIYRNGNFLLQCVNDIVQEVDVLCCELLPKQWEAIAKIKKPCKAKIFGISHAPPHNLEVETLQHKAMLIEAWHKCDYLVAMDIGLESYAPFFAPTAKLLRYPHPVSNVERLSSIKKLSPPHIMLFHIMEPGHHDFDNYLTLKVIESTGAKPVVIVRPEQLTDMSYWLRKMGFSVDMRAPMPQEKFGELVGQCYAICQLAGRPSLGRAVVDAARYGTVSIASKYWYQWFLFSEQIVQTPQELAKKLTELSPYRYDQFIDLSRRRLLELTPKAIGQKLAKELPC